MSADLTDADIREALGSSPDGQRSPLPGEQGSAEFFAARRGFITGSRFKDVMDFNKGTPAKDGKPAKPGKESAKRAAYRAEVVIERITGRSIDHYVSGPMRDGIDREPLAKMAYEARTGRMLTDHGFRRHPTLPMVGGSPDALIGDDGGLEIKCPTPTTHLDTLLNGMDAEHIPQVQGYIWIFGAQWWDFCSYCPHFDEPLRTYIQRIPRDDAYLAELAAGVLTFAAEVELQVAAVRALLKGTP